MKNKKHTPYTYLIGWSEHNQYYYGVRYAKNCHPSDFWVLYFTSSNRVTKMREEYGEPDIIQIRKTFDCPNKAIGWETSVIKRMNLHKRDNFLNACSFPAMSPEILENRIPWNKGKPCPQISKGKMGKPLNLSKEAKKNHSNRMKKMWENGIYDNRAPMREETKEKIRQARLGTSQTERQKRIARETNLGKVLSEETKEKIRQAQIEVSNKMVTCPHCNTTGNGPVMRRWHFSNCKNR